MVQPSQHRFREHDEALANAMSGLLSLEGAGFRRRIGHAGSERHMRTRTVVMAHPDFEDRSQVWL